MGKEDAPKAPQSRTGDPQSASAEDAQSSAETTPKTSELPELYRDLLHDPLLTDTDREVLRQASARCRDATDIERCVDGVLGEYVETLFEKMLPRDRRIFGYDEELTESERSQPRRLMYAFQQGEAFAAGELLRFLRKREQELEYLEAQTLQLLALPEATVPSEEVRRHFSEKVREFIVNSCFSGSGTYGVVYEPCEDDSPSQRLFASDVAVKAYHTPDKRERLLAGIPVGRRNMLRVCNKPPAEEARLHTQLWEFLQEHRLPARVAIPRPLVYFRDYHSGQEYLIMERIAGMTLAELYEYMVGETLHRHAERLPRWVTADVVREAKREMKAALTFLHSHGIFHRDLHPRNVMFPAREPRARDPLLYMIDFGTLAMGVSEEAAYSGLGVNGEHITFDRDEEILTAFELLASRYQEQEQAARPEMVAAIRRFITEHVPIEKGERVAIPNTSFVVLCEHTPFASGDLPLFDVVVEGRRYHIVRPAKQPEW